MNDTFIVYCDIYHGQFGFISNCNISTKEYNTSIYPSYAKIFDIESIGEIHKMLNYIGVKHWIFHYTNH